MTICTSVIYFGVSASTMAFGELEDLVRKIDVASQQLQMRVVVQARESGGAARSPYRSDWVYLVDGEVPYAQIFPHVAATIHWGEADILAEGLKAGKPVAVYGCHPAQLFVSRMCEQSGVGIPPIDPAKCTVESLTWSFQQLLQPAIHENAEMLGRTFDPEQALNNAVQAFHDNLPLAAMRCDVDPKRIARVFDSHRNLKLSLEAYLAVQPVRDETQGFVPYKPLLYDGVYPPFFSIRGNPGEIPHDTKPLHEFDAISMALEVLDAQDELRSNLLSQPSTRSSFESIFAQVANTEVFWTSHEEEEAVRKSTNAAYERLVKPQGLRKRDKVARLFGPHRRIRYPKLSC